MRIAELLKFEHDGNLSRKRSAVFKTWTGIAIFIGAKANIKAINVGG